MVGKTYYQVSINNNIKYRLFREDIGEDELMWHHDEFDRKVLVISGKDWKFQFDNELPIDLVVGTEIEIRNHEFHRILKGKGNLIVKITELNKN